MDKKKAIILDTNFVVAEKVNLNNLLDKFSQNYTVFISQLSVDERKAQECRRFRTQYATFQKFCNEFRHAFTLNECIDCDGAIERINRGMQQKYVNAFSEHIIPFVSSQELLEVVLSRANSKTPPFIDADNASDKGFKDTLIWISLLDYFANSNSYEEVILLTGDNGFRRYADSLCDEFQQRTSTVLSIQDASFINTLSATNDVDERKEQSANNHLDFSSLQQLREKIDVDDVREKIQQTVGDLCCVEVDDWNGTHYERTFSINREVDSSYMERVFTLLKGIIDGNVFETALPAKKVIELDDRVTSIKDIPMCDLEASLLLYEEICTRFPDFVPQFLSAAANIINKNYEEPKFPYIPESEDDLPF